MESESHDGKIEEERLRLKIERQRLRLKIEDYRHIEDFGGVTMTIGVGVATLAYPSGQSIVGMGIIYAGFVLVCFFGWKKYVNEHKLLELLGDKPHQMPKWLVVSVFAIVTVAYWAPSLLALRTWHLWPF